jgi:hypothetical protein
MKPLVHHDFGCQEYILHVQYIWPCWLRNRETQAIGLMVRSERESEYPMAQEGIIARARRFIITIYCKLQ